MADEPKPKVKRWVYPFLSASGKEIEDPQLFLTALSKAQDGSYPIGDNGLWHGGVHFDAGTGSDLLQSEGVRCIADGEVVAYRIDNQYPQVEYPDGKKALYSTGFVLVRHRLELPASPMVAPAAPAPSAPSAPSDEQPALTFFSLYMHVLDWATYKTQSALHRPTHWRDIDSTYVVGDNAKRNQESVAAGRTVLRIRDERNTITGLIPEGTQVTLGDAHPTKRGYFALTGVVTGDTEPAGIRSGYIFRSELTPLFEPHTAALGSIYVLPNPKPIAADSVVGHLGEYGRYADATQLPPRPTRPLLHFELFTGEDIADFIAKSRARSAQLEASQKSLLVIESGAKLCQPATFDKSVPAGAKIAKLSKDAGGSPWVSAKVVREKIVALSELSEPHGSGSNGSFLYQNERVSFTGNYFNAAGQKTDNREQRGSYPLREILLPEGDAFWIESGRLQDTAERPVWSTYPLDTANITTPVVNFTRTLSKNQLNKLPAADRAQDAQGVKWYRIDVGAADGTNQTGWVCEKEHPRTSWKSPWDWPGFEVLTETTEPVELFARKLDQLGMAASPEEALDLTEKASAADQGALLTRLRTAIDAEGNHDGKVDGDELRKALRQPWLAEPITKLIVNYESEWAGPMEKWDAMDSLMLEGLPIWNTEKERIKNLNFFNQINAVKRFFDVHKINHINFSGLITNFWTAPSLITIEMLIAVSPVGGSARFLPILPHLNKYALSYKVDTPKKISHFLSQVAHESELKIVEESLSYSGQRMRQIFGCVGGPKKYKSDTDDCAIGRLREKLWTQETFYEHNAERLGNYVYSNRMRNGDESSGDGYKYRGRGIIQMTGKDKYVDFQENHNELNPSDKQDFVNNPDLVISNVDYGVESAFFFWKSRNLNSTSESGNVEQVTQIVNGGQNGYLDRKLRYNAIAPLLGLKPED